MDLQAAALAGRLLGAAVAFFSLPLCSLSLRVSSPANISCCQPGHGLAVVRAYPGVLLMHAQSSQLWLLMVACSRDKAMEHLQRPTESLTLRLLPLGSAWSVPDAW